MSEPPLVLITEAYCPHLCAALEMEGWRLAWVGAVEALQAAQIDAVLHLSTQPLHHDFLSQFPNLSAISVIGEPGDDLGALQAAKPHLQVFGTASSDAEDAAELALGLLYTARFELSDQTWPERDPAWVEERTLRRRKLGILGLDAVGAAFARRVAPLGMDIRWWGSGRASGSWPRADSLLDLAAWADILLVCPSTDSSQEPVSAHVVGAVGSHGLLLSLADQGAVDEEAVIEALVAHRLGAAVLTVPEREESAAELSGTPGLLLTSRSASLTLEFMVECATSAIGQLRRRLQGANVIAREESQSALQREALERAFRARETADPARGCVH